MIAAAAMGFSSVFVVGNALRLRTWKPSEGNEPTPAGTVQVSVEQDNRITTEGKPMVDKKLKVEGMMCQHCVKHVKEALEGVDGVASADVDLEAGTAVAHCDAAVSDEALLAAVRAADYTCEMA